MALKALTDKYVKTKRKSHHNFLYTCFVDFSKAFDNISRDTLYTKLNDIGVQGKFLNIIQDMYDNDSACVKINNNISEPFRCYKGVKQGCMLSPTLFNIYLSDLPNILNKDKDAPELNQRPVSCLLYADDLVIISKTHKGLQNNMNRLVDYCKKNSLNINESKTKIMIFNPNGKNLNRYLFQVGSTTVENVTKYKYLGLTLSASASYSIAKQELKKIALKAYYSLRKTMGISFRRHLPLTIYLFNTLIKPILTYSSEIWALDTTKYNELRDPIEQLHSTFCKHILGVSRRATNKACRAEIGSFPIIIEAKSKAISFWARLLTLDNSRIAKQAYLDQIIHATNSNWAMEIKTLLFQNGFGYIWDLQQEEQYDYTKIKQIYKQFKQRLEDIERQNWLSSLYDDNRKSFGGNRLRTFREFKTEYKLEEYLIKVSDIEHRRALTKLRISDHILQIERGRYSKDYIKPELRICPHCHIMEDEAHFLLDCTLYENIRNTLFLDIKTNANFKQLIDPKNNVNKIAKYVHDCFKIRQSIPS